MDVGKNSYCDELLINMCYSDAVAVSRSISCFFCSEVDRPPPIDIYGIMEYLKIVFTPEIIRADITALMT